MVEYIVLFFGACSHNPLRVKEIVTNTGVYRTRKDCGFTDKIEYLVWAKMLNNEVRPYWIEKYGIKEKAPDFSEAAKRAEEQVAKDNAFLAKTSTQTITFTQWFGLLDFSYRGDIEYGLRSDGTMVWRVRK